MIALGKGVEIEYAGKAVTAAAWEALETEIEFQVDQEGALRHSHAWETLRGALDHAVAWTLEAVYPRSWKERLFSWPWRPRANRERRTFLGRILRVEWPIGPDLTIEVEGPVRREVFRE